MIQLLSAFFGSLGFSLLYGMRRRYLFSASLGGICCWGVYLAAERFFESNFLSCLLAAAFAVIYAEFLAHRLKSPATLFVVPAVLPLVPGSSLYYAMDYAVHRQYEDARAFGSLTLESALAIAAGMSFVIACRELHTKR
ncbi:MAG: threonine/serine exporter family protein [Oscillospiraceae bacterium]|nr:threonine/serine exporter family protein [Oscillospiraceae bacterium]